MGYKRLLKDRDAITSFKHRFIIHFSWSAQFTQTPLEILYVSRDSYIISLLLFLFLSFWAAFSKNNLIQAVTNDTWFVQIWRYQNIFYTSQGKTMTLFHFRLSLVERHKLLLSNLCLPLSFFVGIYLRPCLYLSCNIGNHNMCVWSCIQLLSDYFYPPVFAATVKLTIGATSIIQAIDDRYTEGCTEEGVPEEERECSFPLACIFLNIRVALLVEFSYIGGERTLRKSLHIKPYPYTLSTHRYRR